MAGRASGRAALNASGGRPQVRPRAGASRMAVHEPIQRHLDLHQSFPSSQAYDGSQLDRVTPVAGTKHNHRDGELQ